MSIGVVLERLREEFPDVSLSKIRFLESEGLITPQRTASGYRRFTDEDVERLRYILVTQRDNYLPLKVIREQLEAMDSGQVTAIMSGADAEPMVSADNFRAPADTKLSDEDVAEQANTDQATVAQLCRVECLGATCLYWPGLDLELPLERIRDPMAVVQLARMDY